MELVKIRDMSEKYRISARTLRYYEEVGLIQSVRCQEYAYRMYDETAICRLEQILILRKLNISIKDIRRIFSAKDAGVVLEVLQKKMEEIEDDISLLQELREIVMEFSRTIRQIDFEREAEVRRLYERAKKVEIQIAEEKYAGNPSVIHRLWEVAERMDKKVPDIMVVRIPKFRAVTSGKMSGERIFSEFMLWQEAHRAYFRPVIMDAPDFLCGRDGRYFEWFWALRENVTEEEVKPYAVVEFPGGLYAMAVSVDADDESYGKVRKKMLRWLENTDFEEDMSRDWMGNMIFTDEEIHRGLGYHQMIQYIPIKLR